MNVNLLRKSGDTGEKGQEGRKIQRNKSERGSWKGARIERGRKRERREKTGEVERENGEAKWRRGTNCEENGNIMGTREESSISTQRNHLMSVTTYILFK